jgi:hypothetical protein
MSLLFCLWADQGGQEDKEKEEEEEEKEEEEEEEEIEKKEEEKEKKEEEKEKKEEEKEKDDKEEDKKDAKEKKEEDDDEEEEVDIELEDDKNEEEEGETEERKDAEEDNVVDNPQGTCSEAVKNVTNADGAKAAPVAATLPWTRLLWVDETLETTPDHQVPAAAVGAAARRPSHRPRIGPKSRVQRQQLRGGDEEKIAEVADADCGGERGVEGQPPVSTKGRQSPEKPSSSSSAVVEALTAAANQLAQPQQQLLNPTEDHQLSQQEVAKKADRPLIGPKSWVARQKVEEEEDAKKGPLVEARRPRIGPKSWVARQQEGEKEAGALGEVQPQIGPNQKDVVKARPRIGPKSWVARQKEAALAEARPRMGPKYSIEKLEEVGGVPAMERPRPRIGPKSRMRRPEESASSTEGNSEAAADPGMSTC